MRVLILGFDGLNWLTARALIVRYPEVKTLFQKSWGIYSVDTDFSSIYLWTSIITGIPPRKLGKLYFVERKGVPGWARRLPEPIKKLGRKLLKPYPPNIKGKYKTIFEEASSPLPFNVLGYNEDPRQFKLRMKYSLVDTIGDTEKSMKAYHDWMTWNKLQAKEFLSKLLTQDWDLAMTHFWIIDISNHLLGESKVHETYRFAAEVLKQVKHYFDREAAILAVSDHGTYRRLHTSDAFWSLNREIDSKLKPTRIWHFKKLITTLLEAVA